MRRNEQLTFTKVCKRIKKKNYDTKQFPEDIKLLLEIAGCFFAGTAAAAAAGGVAGGGIGVAAVIAAISEKGKVLSGVKRIIELLSKNAPGYADRYEHMQEAYTLLCVSSFFDAYTNILPNELLSKIELSAKEQAKLVPTDDATDEISGQIDEPSICFPHIVYGCDRVYDILSELYYVMAKRLSVFISNLAFYEEADDNTKQTLEEKLNELPNAALKVFKDQYLTLCSTFSDFYAYVNIEKELEYKNEADERYQKLVEMILHSENAANKSFEALKEAISSLPAIQREKDAEAVLEHIKGKYKRAVNRTIVASDDDDNLTYPTIEEAFIPQRYRLLEYCSKDTRLELETEWDKYEERDDMLAYWAKYVLDPQSIDHIFLILGDPGGGKSLLMEMVSAQLSSDAEPVIKIPLRHYSNMSEMDIETMLCSQISDDGDSVVKIEKFKQITGENPKRPFTLIFDGYDEVQQATGMAFRLFLTKLKDFQNRCKEDKRPVRIIVTSRRTLIDKADIPLGTTVMKLLDFDPIQKDEWITIWNKCNHNNLQSKGLMDFSLPDGSAEIDELSGQPLLLLMLAIYDADFENGENTLQKSAKESPNEGLNRMRLYDELIRRFVRRELMKGKRGDEVPYADANDTRRKELIDAEMDKLGIAAFGMFIREKLFITVPELKGDIQKFKTEALDYSSEGALDASEVFFGSFFFIHDSRIEGERQEEASHAALEFEKDASFVFLHKTFYEFLVADYALSSLYRYAIDLAAVKNFREHTYNSKVVAFDDEFPQFYLSASGSPLCAEPEIIKMIAEWCNQKLEVLSENNSLTKETIVSVIEDIIERHVDLIKNDVMNPGNDLSLIHERPIPQRNAIYIINLVTLIALIEGEWNTNVEMWRFIAQFVKLNAPQFKENSQRAPLRHRGMDASEELPLKFMALFQVQSSDKTLKICRRNESFDSDDRTPLDAKSEVFAFLQDNITRSIYSLHSSKTPRTTKKILANEIVSFDSTVRIDNEIHRLQDAIMNDDANYSSYKAIRHFVTCLSKGLTDISRIITWLSLYRQVMHKNISIEDYHHLRKTAYTGTEYISRLILFFPSTFPDDNTAVIRLWIRVLKELHITTGIRGLFENSIRSMRYDLRESKEWIFEAARELPFGDENNFSIKTGLHFHNPRYDNENSYHYVIRAIASSGFYSSPKVLAALLEAERKFRNTYSENKEHFDYRHEVDSFMRKYASATWENEYNSFWVEMPCLMRELVIRGSKNYVRKILDRIELDNKMITDSAIKEYVSIAGAVSAQRFLKRTVMSLDWLNLSEIPNNTCSAILRAFYSLLLLNRENGGSLVKRLFHEREFVSYCINYSPTQTARVLCLVLRWFYKEPPYRGEYYISELLLKFETILKQSPSTAIEFLSLISKTFQLKPSIVNYYRRIVQLEGYQEELNHYFDR